MVTKVGLANMALDILGVDNIAVLTESSSAARKVNARIDGCIKAVLEMSDWTFARKVQALAEVTNTDWTERYERKYDLPSDMIKAHKLVPAIDLPNTSPIPYALANGSLYTDEADAKLRFTFSNTDTSKWPESFATTVAAYIAREVAMPLTRKRQTWVDANAMFGETLGMAIQFDASQEATYYGFPSQYLSDRGSVAQGYDSRGVDGSSYWES